MTSATMAEYLVDMSPEKTLDRTAAVWMLGCYGSTASMLVRGTSLGTMPCFGSRLLSPGASPPTLLSAGVTGSLVVPSIAALTQVGLRLRAA